MFRSIISQIDRDKDYPARQFTIDVNNRILHGALYEHLKYAFHDEKTNGGEYIDLRKRRPSAEYNICEIVVTDSVSLLFSDGHFPTPHSSDEKVRDALKSLVKDAKLNLLMLEAATAGSVGSVAIQMKVLKQSDETWRAFFSTHSTEFLEPIYDPQNPEKLIRLRERYKVRGSDLADLGYSVGDDEMSKLFWFTRDWDSAREIWFKPVRVDNEKAIEAVDEDKTVPHGLGFVPWVWVKNLPGKLRLYETGLKFSDVDGACTFHAAIKTMIEIEYLLSQGGRGLKYSMDPQLVLKQPDDEGGELIRGASNALVMDPQSDAKLLELGGSAFQVVLDWVKALRELALESAHGNRTEATKLGQATSGRAMELMNQSLIWLSDRLRVTYGEGALLSLLNMTIEAHRIYPLHVAGEAWPDMPKVTNTSLKWPQWHPPTYSDLLTQAQGIDALTDGGNMSRETAVTTIAGNYDVEDVGREMSQIDSDIAKASAVAIAEAAQVKANTQAPI